MQQPRKGHPAMKIHKGKHMVGKHHAADHQAQHGQQQKQVKRQQKDTGGREPAAKQVLMPLPVQDVMQDEQKEHPGPGPLVRHFAPELVAHQEQQRQRHQNVDQYFTDRFRFHANPPVSAHSRPRPASQPLTSLWTLPSSPSVRARPSRIVAPAALSPIPERLLPKPPLALVLKGIRVFPVKS